MSVEHANFLTTAASLVSEVDISHPFIYRSAYVNYWESLRKTISQNPSVTAKFVEDRVGNTEHCRILVTERVPSERAIPSTDK